MTGVFLDGNLLENIKRGGALRQKAIAFIYRDKELKNQVINFVRKNGGSREDGIDIFHEGIIAFDDNIRKDKYKGEGKLKGYLFSICRFLWLNKLKRNKRMVYTDENNQLDQVSYDTPESLSMDEEQKNIIGKLLGQLDKKCEQILELWKLSYSMEEIAEKVGIERCRNCKKTTVQLLPEIIENY